MIKINMCNFRANILLSGAYMAKLGDFGFAIELPQLSHGITMFSSECMIRSEGYYPAEISMGRYSDRSDVYSFGVVSVYYNGVLYALGHTK